MIVEQESSPTVGYEDNGDTCADNFDDDWEDMNDENDDSNLGAVGGAPLPRKAKKPVPQPRKKAANPGDENSGLIGKMAESVTAMAGVYTANKKSVSPNAVWANLLADKIDKLDEEVQEDKRIEIDNLVHDAIREKRRALKEKQ